MDKIIETFTRYFISSAVTFATAFLFAVLPFLGNVSWDQAALFALIMTGTRAGVKAAAEELLSTMDKEPKSLPR